MPQRLDEFLATSSDTNIEPKSNSIMRLGDYLSMEEDTLETQKVKNAFYAPTTTELKEWKSKGEIGYFEQAIRQDKTEMIPFNPEAAVKSVKLLRAVNRIKADKYEDEVQKNRDYSLVNDFLRKKEEERIRGYTIGGRIAQGIAVLPGYMIEFLATGGLATLGKKTVGAAINPAIRTIAKNKALSFGVRNIGAVTGAVYRTAAMPHRIAKSYAERQIGQSLELTESGYEISKNTIEKPYTSFMKAIGDVVIENYSEVTGGELTKFSKKFIPNSIARNIAKIFKKLHPNKSISTLFTRMGWNGFIGELGEERIGGFLRALFNIEDFGAKNKESVLDRIISSVPTGEEMLIEAGILAFPGVTKAGISQTLNIIQSRRGKIEEKIPEDLTERKIETILTAKPTKEIIAEVSETIKEVAKLPVEAKVPEALPEAEPTPKLSFKFQQRISQIRREFRTEKAITKKEIKAVQEEIIRGLEQAELEPKDKAKFIRAVKNVQTSQQLTKALPEIQERMGRLIELEEKRELISDIKSETQKSKLRKLRPEFQEPIMNLIESIDIDPRSEEKIKSLQATLNFIEENPDNQIPQKRINELKKLDQKAIRDFTAEELKNLSDSINHFIKLNNLKNKIIIKRKIKEVKEVTNQAVKNLNTRHEQLNGSLDGLDSMQEEKERPLWQKIFGVDSLGAEDKCIILDGEDHGVIMQILYEGIDEGVNEQFKTEHTAEDFFKKRFVGINIKNWSRAFQSKENKLDKVKVKISGDRTITMTKAERVAFILHNRNAKNVKHLEKGGFSFEKTPSKITNVTSEDIDKIVNSATPEELRVTDAIGEYLDTIQKDKINEVSIYLDGFKIATENNYWHIRTNYLDRIKETIIKKGNYSQKTLEGLGIFKERQDVSNAIILEDAFTSLYKSIKLSAAYIGLAKPLRSAKTLLNDNDFLKAAINVGRQHYTNSLKDYIRRIEGESIRMENLDKLTTEWINRLDTSILGLNPFVSLKQRISWFLAGTEMNWEILRKHLPKKPSIEEIDEMRKWSPQLRDRLDGNVTRELGEVAQVGRVRKFFTGEEASLKLQSIRNNDTMVMTAIWNAIKEEVKTTKPKLREDAYWEEVAERTWEVIRRTQPTFHIKDRSTIGMSRQLLWRLMTKYSSQRNKNWRIIRRKIEEYNRSPKTSKDKSHLMASLFTVTVVNSLCIMLINMVRGMLFRKKDDKFKKNIFKRAIMDFFLTPLSNIYLIGEFASSIASKIDKGTFAGFEIENPASSTINDLTNVIADGVRSISQAITSEKYKAGVKKGEEKWITSLGRVAKGVFDIAGRIKGVNLANIRRFFNIPFTFMKEKKVYQ